MLMNGCRRILSAGLAAVMALSLSLGSVNAANTIPSKVTVVVTATYGQTVARTMIDLVNDMRKNDAWYWNESNTAKVELKNLKALTYDYELEKAAMQRAMEVAVYQDHVRPDGNSFKEAYSSTYNGTKRAENIAIESQGTPSNAMSYITEADGKYASQGHRRNMLNENYVAFAVGHVYYNGFHYWVQEFSSKLGSTTKTTAKDSAGSADVSILTANLESYAVENDVKDMNVKAGQTKELPTCSASIRSVKVWPKGTGCAVKMRGQDWAVKDKTVAKISGNSVETLKNGTTKITGTYLDKTIEFTLTVSDSGEDGDKKEPEEEKPGKPDDPSNPDEPNDPNNPDNPDNPEAPKIPEEQAGDDPYEQTHTHAFETVVSPATPSFDGCTYQFCPVCNQTKDVTVIKKIGKMNLSKTKYTYSGKAKKPAVKVVDASGVPINSQFYSISYGSGCKKVGQYKVTVTFKGNYSGTLAKTFTIVPKGTKIAGLKAVKKGITVKVKKNKKQTTGYQLQYGTKKNFKGAKKVSFKNTRVLKKLTKLKAGKKYYIRVRTYKTVKINGKSKKLYSAWSKKKSIKTKK